MTPGAATVGNVARPGGRRALGDRGSRGRVTRLGGSALLAVVVILTAACGSSSSPPATSAPSGTALPAPVGVHVVHPSGSTPYLADADGRFLLLRGVDDNALVQYATNYREAPSVARSDFGEMAALGFNYVRLPVSWSRIMPAPGKLDRAYLDRVAQVVSWARSEGIGVLVDMHEDNFSAGSDPGNEADGAPPWAAVGDVPPCTPEATTTSCSLADFTSFWADQTVAGKGLQQWYLEAMTAVAKAAGAGARTGNVVGVELMNEPWPAGPSPFEQTSLYPFYRRMVSGLRTAGVVAPLWFEPSLVRNVTDSAVSVAQRFSDDPDLVYAVHIYTGVFSPPYDPTTSQPQMATSYANAAKEAAVFDAPFVVDEFGSTATPEWNSWLQAQLDNQNTYQVGSGFWLWKQREGKWDNWAVVHLDGSLRSGTLRAQLLSQPHVDSAPGHLTATTATAGSLTATVDGSGGTMSLWGGTVVEEGGTSTTTRTLRQVTVDGRPVVSHCRTVAFETTAVHLAGCLLTFTLSPGSHQVRATP